MPGTEVKNWPVYEALRKRGFSKANAARIANASVRRGRGKKKATKGRKHG